MQELPTGTVTFLFTDIEGSTRLLRELGADDYNAVQTDHMRIMREAIAAGGGVEIRTEGDAFFAAFPTATGALSAAVRAQRAMHSHPWSHGGELRVRIGMHTGTGALGGDDYLGIDVNRAARIAAAGHGGQILLSHATRALVTDELPAGVIVRDLGQHRLKDFAAPALLYDLVIDGLPAKFPPLKTLDTPTNLPAELTSFVGREHELQSVNKLLKTTRLLTLTGPGGSGKTRLALRAAAGLLERFPDGVFFVELASIEESHLVPSVIASVIGSGEMGPRSVLENLEIELRPRTCLLVLDNFEQVIEAALGVGALLASAPRIRALVTSRGPLRIRGEQEFPVPPLKLPDPTRLGTPEELTRYEALALFLERATAVDPSFALDQGNSRAVVEICRRLDGLPLAIELAASRLRLLSPAAILERLDRALPLLSRGGRDLPARQRTLRGAIEWSYDLLVPEAAGWFRRLCVFAGGFTIAAAESVIDPQGELGIDTLEGLEDLLDASLVRRKPVSGNQDRFETLQTVREYGLEKLDEHAEAAAVRRRHALHFLELAEATDPELRGPDIEQKLEVLTLEHDNMRAALAWMLESDEGETGLRMVAALWRFWQLRGHLTAGRRWADQVLALPSAQGRTRLRARALLANGSLAYWQNDWSPMERDYAEGLAIFREVEDTAGIALATYNLGFAYAVKGVEEAGELIRASRGVFEEIGDPRGVGDTLFGLSGVTWRLGDFATARAQAQEALRLHKELGDLFGVHGDLYILGRAIGDGGDPDTARKLFLETLAFDEHLQNSTGIALSLDLLAYQEAALGRPLRAMRLAGAAEAIKESVGGEAPPELLGLGNPRALARELIGEEEIQSAWNEGRAMSLDEAIAYARTED